MGLGPLLAGCGGALPASAVPVPTVLAGATVAPTPTAHASAAPLVTPTAAASTATRPATVGAARTPSATPTTGSALLRALALLPRSGSLPGDEGISFADLRTQKGNYGLAGATSAEAFRALGVGDATLNAVIGGLPLPQLAGIESARAEGWRETIGYDLWQIERTVGAGAPPSSWNRLEGRFSRSEIAAALDRAGHRAVAYGGATILARGEDGQLLDLKQPLTRLILALLNRVTLEDGALSASPHSTLIEAGIDARAGRGQTFADDPDYAAVAGALGAVVGARIIPPEQFFRPPSSPLRPQSATPRVTPRADASRLPPYRLVGLGLRDDGATHTMLVASLYDDPAVARAAAPLLRERAASYRLLATNGSLSARASVGTPETTVGGDRAVVVLPFAIADRADLGLWQRMLHQRDYGFLAE
jgi:hypothetical protein